MPDLPTPGAATPDGGSQPPFGSSPASGPTPNQGYEAQALQQLGVTIKQLEALVPLVGSNSELGMEVLKTLPRLAKFSPPGAVSPAGERNVMEQAMLKNAAQSLLLQKLKAAQAQQAMQGGAAPGGAPGGPPGGAAPGGPPGGAPQPRMM